MARCVSFRCRDIFFWEHTAAYNGDEVKLPTAVSANLCLQRDDRCHAVWWISATGRSTLIWASIVLMLAPFSRQLLLCFSLIRQRPCHSFAILFSSLSPSFSFILLLLLSTHALPPPQHAPLFPHLSFSYSSSLSAGTHCHFLNSLTGPTSISASPSSFFPCLSGAEGRFSVKKNFFWTRFQSVSSPPRGV